MTYDPFLDPPRRGCALVAAVPAVALVVVAGLVWGLGDAVAAAFWLLFFGTIAVFAVADEARHSRRRSERAHPTSTFHELEPLPRSHVRIVPGRRR